MAKKSMTIDTSDAAWAKLEKKFAKMSPEAASHLVDFEAGVSRDARKAAAKKATAKKATTKKVTTTRKKK